ncbi:transcription factor HES-7 [Mauremys reevesii]|uniref:transcription factor HES-7 n=1 Tax=Mauremys reevesii TaxID=260615 RepID=UPI00193FA6A4|nr:transcription factor HES-7 [Mauremys reevesii]
MVTKGVSEPAALRKMLKPLAEKRRRERINRSLEELRVLLLDRTRHQTLQNRKVEKAEILELAVRYLREWSAPAGRGADPAGRPTLCSAATCWASECLLRLSAFVRDARPCAHGQLLDALHVYLAARCRPVPPEPASGLRPASPARLPSLPQPFLAVPPPLSPPRGPGDARPRPFHRPGAPETHGGGSRFERGAPAAGRLETVAIESK